MANQIRILPPSDRLSPGETMRVPITLALEAPLKARGIHASFRAGEETKAVYQAGKHQHTAVELIEITKQDFVLFGNPKLGFIGNLNDAAATLVGGGKHETLEAGEHSFEVEVSVPLDAPPTHAGKKSRVFYELAARVDVPLALDIKVAHLFQVDGFDAPLAQIEPVVARYPDASGRKALDSLFGPDVKIEMALAANQVRFGEIIAGIVVIDTPKPLQCRALRVRLVGLESSQAKGKRDSHSHKMPPTEISQPGVVSGTYKQEFSLPAQAAPLSARGKNFSMDWFVQIEFDVPWAKDPKIQAPITLLPALPELPQESPPSGM